MRSPGDPLNSENLPQNQGITPYIYAPSFYGVANPNYRTGFKLPYGQVIPVHKGNYNSRDIPFQPMKTDYKS